ncbi:MAG: hypothetical protein V4751_04970 [Pseudomonadota bacterium]
MKKLLCALLFTLAATQAAAQTTYTGVWAMDVPLTTNYYSVHQNGSAVIVASLDASDAEWEALQGSITSNVAVVNSIYTQGGSFNVRITFSSTTTGSFVVLSCTPSPGRVCAVPVGVTIPIKKIF